MKNESIFLRLPQVMEMTSFSRSTIWRREQEGKFPKRIRLSHNLVLWNSNEIDRFLKNPTGYQVSGGKK